MFSHCSSSDESAQSVSFVNTKSTFRISLNLQRYFEDVRARSYVLVTRNRKVRWLQTRIQKLFSLPGGFYLCTNGHFLPPSEPLGLLSHDDCIDVIPLEAAQTEQVQLLNEENIKIVESKCQNVKEDLATEATGDSTSIVTTESRRDDETRVSECGSQSSRTNGAAGEVPSALRGLKRRALALLDTLEGAELPRRTPRVRRRVRRRPARAHSASAPPVNQEEDAEVVRNEWERSRTPRLVRALDAGLGHE